MITDPEWNILSQKAFPKPSAKAPPYLWTRILARIEQMETGRSGSWWLQWRWMTRVTVAAGLVAGLATYFLVQNSAAPLEAVLDGRSAQEQAIHIASSDLTTEDQSAAMILEFDS